MFNSFGLGEIIVILFSIIILCIPILLVWFLFRTIQKISKHNEQIENQMKALREELRSIKEQMPTGSPK
jgi:uncharacterized protein YoxC